MFAKRALTVLITTFHHIYLGNKLLQVFLAPIHLSKIFLQVLALIHLSRLFFMIAAAVSVFEYNALAEFGFLCVAFTEMMAKRGKQFSRKVFLYFEIILSTRPYRFLSR